jgi:hypothetical protein
MNHIRTICRKYKIAVGLILLIWIAWFITRMFADLSLINGHVLTGLASVFSYYVYIFGVLFKE